MRVDTPKGNVSYLPVGSATASFTAEEAGSYTVTVTVAGNSSQYSIFAALPEAECVPVSEQKEFSLYGTASDRGFDGVYKDLTVLFVILALVFAADWGVYCYEKYQL